MSRVQACLVEQPPTLAQLRAWASNKHRLARKGLADRLERACRLEGKCQAFQDRADRVLMTCCAWVARRPRYTGTVGRMVKAVLDDALAELRVSPNTRRECLKFLQRHQLVAVGGTHPKLGIPLADLTGYQGAHAEAFADETRARATARKRKSREAKTQKLRTTPNRMAATPPCGAVYGRSRRYKTLRSIDEGRAPPPRQQGGARAEGARPCSPLLRRAYAEVFGTHPTVPHDQLVARYHPCPTGRWVSYAELVALGVDSLPGFRWYHALKARAGVQAWRHALVLTLEAMNTRHLHTPGAYCGWLASRIERGHHEVFTLEPPAGTPCSPA